MGTVAEKSSEKIQEEPMHEESKKSIQHTVNPIVKKHDKIGCVVILLLVFSLFIGCATSNIHTINKNVLEGRYDVVVAEFESQKTPEQATLSELFYLARSYFYLHDYTLFEKYAALFLTRYKEKFYALPHFTKEEALSIVFCMKAKVLLDLGKYSDAQIFAQKAEAQIPNFNFRSTWQYYFKNIIEVYETSGLVHALSGNKVEAESYIIKLNELSYFAVLDNPLSKKVSIQHKIIHSTTQKQFRSNVYDVSFYDDKVLAMAKIYFANKNYAAAKNIIENDLELTSFNVVADTIQKISEQFGEKWRKERLYVNLSKFFMITKCRFETGETSAAKEGYESLLSHSQIKNMGDIYWVTLLDLGCIHVLDGNLEKALELFEKAAEIIERQRSTINSEAGKIGFVGDKQEVYYHIIKTLFEERRYERVFEFIERSKSRALVDLLASKSNFASDQVDVAGIDALLEELNAVERESVRIAGASLTSPNSNSRAIVIRKISKTSPELASLITVESTDAKSLQALIPPGETVVEYYAHGNDWYCIIATQNSVQGVELDCAEVSREVADFRKALLKSSLDIREVNTATVKPPSVETGVIAPFDLKCRNLCKKIFDPLEEKIPTRNVTIVPHGALHYLPFGALLTENGYLIERYNIRVLPSVSVLKFLARQEDRKIGDLFILGNPDLSDPKYDLPFAQDEALALKNLMADSKVLLRDQATETAIKKYGNQFTKIHIACHGAFNADDALHSGLFLSTDGENDGMLTVSELYDMRLNTNLVTLSACETALGKVANGDDVVGFTRGFLYAGANSIVSSLWKVDDRATSLLMQEFYQNLNKMDKRTALRKAQLKIKNEYLSHPFFWAAFQLTGATY